jgi:hypothetical protein
MSGPDDRDFDEVAMKLIYIKRFGEHGDVRGVKPVKLPGVSP